MLHSTLKAKSHLQRLALSGVPCLRHERRAMLTSTTPTTPAHEEHPATTDKDNKDLATYLQESLRIDRSLQDGIIKVVRNMYGKDVNVKQELQRLSRPDVQALVQSAASAAAATKTRKRPVSRPSCTIQIVVPQESNKTLTLQWKQGETLLDLAQRNPDTLGQYMPGACGGTMACSTCHVYVDVVRGETTASPQDHNNNNNDNDNIHHEMDDMENDLLDLAYERDPAKSRLGCQVRLTPPLLLRVTGCGNNKDKNDNIVVTIPPGVNNLWNE